ncbi:hypothetical protein GCM10010326_39890 [Streptomyces xanthochromogenes]|uniref:Uncharacterized protein n=1 Tax=Streptomyces xanthochromogenes TaxID=67384 RepID=A0ABQ3AC33_9ACTN|nr:hypothetical protein GCM10010326_39890 [Streptomyces xanthochromogenes]
MGILGEGLVASAAIHGNPLFHRAPTERRAFQVKLPPPARPGALTLRTRTAEAAERPSPPDRGGRLRLLRRCG